VDDLISRAAAIDHMKAMAGCAKCDNYNYVRCRACSWDDAMNIVEELPAVAAAPVVRCKDCGYFQANNAEEGDWSGRCTNVYVPMNGMTVDGWWFCADGKRREDDGKIS